LESGNYKIFLTFFLKSRKVKTILLPPRFVMKTKILSILIVPLALSVSACGDTWGQRAVTGAGIGAGAGLAVGALAGWPLIGPALVGAALGGGIGAATAPGGIK
jgi:osmotically inducible lipoprotein OsmB